ncbi:MAG: insulinase family protein [Cellulosilyticaceae bacterium]
MEQTIKGYTLKEVVYIKEIDCNVHQYEHNKTKANIIYFEADDVHKTFGVTFRTPQSDSTGVPHIIEHSVLCGSKKYPLKDPFIELSKGSLNTYLNAMTYADKTMYPISSQNDADFRNLMNVYLDAVFFPNIYENPMTLMQEGWRYHIENEDQPLEYKGVVYNEMKGAFSSAEEIAFRKIKEELFPDTTYAHESGGAPENIPELTEEEFLAYHKRYYHPSNAYIGLYGAVNIEETLTFIDEMYLQHFEYEDVDSTVKEQKAFEEVKMVKIPYSVADEEEMMQHYVSYNCVVGETVNRKLMIEMAILEYILLETPAAPLKKALIKEGVGEDVFGAFQTHMKQPIFTIMAKNVKKDKIPLFYEIVEKELNRLVKEGIPQTLLNGAVQVKEFELRESDYKGYSKGLFYYINSMKSWMYDESPLIYLQYEDILKELHKEKTEGYFETLIEKYLLQNKHALKLELYPEIELNTKLEILEREKLAKIKESWDKETLQKHIDKTRQFEEYQNEEEEEETKYCIPILTKDELKREVTFPKYEIKKRDNREYIVTPTFTNRIVYMTWYIDLDGIDNKYMPYLGMLVGLFGKLNTTNYTYEDLSIAIDQHLGSIDYYIDMLYNFEDATKSKPVFVLKSKALQSEIDNQIKIMKEMITQTQFIDKQRIYEIIKEMKAIMEMTVSSEGHKIAYNRLLSNFSKIEAFEEETKGLTFYHMVCDFVKNWETMQDGIIENLNKAYSYCANHTRYTVGLTVDEKDVESCIDKIETCLSTLKDEKFETVQNEWKPSKCQEALVFPGNVNYVAMGYNFKEDGYSYHGGLLVLKSILANDYLWNEVRVKNGAYGCFADFRKSGNVMFVSYRDPNIAETIDIYRNIPEFVKTLNLDDREILQYLIGTISNMDFPYTPSTEGNAAQSYYLTHTTKEDLQQIRDEIFETNNDKLRSFADMIQSVLTKNQYCVFGNMTSITENESLFTDITKV